MKAVVIGGGISGLTTAYRLRRQGVDVRLFEAGSRLGGNIRTVREGGFVFDAGPDSWVAAKPQAKALCEELGLGPRLMGPDERNRRVYILRKGRLIPMPEGMVLGLPARLFPFLSSELLPLRAKLRVLTEALRRRRLEGDPSIADFLGERFGREMADVVLEPLLGGVYAGDGRELSLRAAFPQLAAMAEKHGSILRAVRAMQKGRPASKEPMFLTLRGGLGELVEALEKELRDVVQRDTKVTAVTKADAGFEVRLASGDRIEAEHVVLALPAHAASSILAPLDPELSHELYGIPYVSTATVFFGWQRREVGHPLDATGFIVPVNERRHVMAATFVSSKWEGRAPEGQVLVRAFVGGGRDESILASSDEKLVELARKELGPALGVQAEPSFVRVIRYDRASPQPALGHLERMKRIAARLEAFPGLHVIGNAYEGVGIPDCVRHADRVAATIAKAAQRA